MRLELPIGLAALLAAILPTIALPGGANASQFYVKVQPIQVCDSAGANCAAVTVDEAATQQIFDQTGLAVQWAPTVTYDAPSSAVQFQPGLGLVTTVQGSGGDATDPAHILLRGYQEPPNPAPADPQTLNLFFVGALQRSDNGPINGLGLIGGNGMIIADASTGLGANTGVPVDVSAHEIGHNLGLKDVDLPNSGVAISPADVPVNLMNSLSRDTPPGLPITTDGLNGTDHLLPAQAVATQQPLFTVDGASAIVSNNDPRLVNKCAAGALICDQLLSTPASSSTEALLALKIRFAAAQGAPALGAFVGALPGVGNACAGSASGVQFLPSGGSELDINFFAGCFQGENSVIELLYNQNGYVPPFSYEFDFSDGITSTAQFDASTGIADSTLHAVYAIKGPTSAPPGFVLPNVQALSLDYAPPSFPQSVPEPASALLLLAGVWGMAALRRNSNLAARHSLNF